MILGELIFEPYYFGRTVLMITHPNGEMGLDVHDVGKVYNFLESFLDKFPISQQLILTDLQLDLDIGGEVCFMFNDYNESMSWLRYDEINELVIFLKQIL